jgi:hypothetical protein
MEKLKYVYNILYKNKIYACSYTCEEKQYSNMSYINMTKLGINSHFSIYMNSIINNIYKAIYKKGMK